MDNIKECIVCGNEFVAKKKNSATCSDKCKQLYFQAREKNNKKKRYEYLNKKNMEYYYKRKIRALGYNIDDLENIPENLRNKLLSYINI